MKTIQFPVNYNTNEQRLREILVSSVVNMFPFEEVYIKPGWFSEFLQKRNLTAYTHETSEFSVKIICNSDNEITFYTITGVISLGDFFCLDIKLVSLMEGICVNLPVKIRRKP